MIYKQKCLHTGRGREISSDFVKMNSLAYDGTLEFIFAKSAQASRISKIGLPVICYSYNLNYKNNILHVPDNLSTSVSGILRQLPNSTLFSFYKCSDTCGKSYQSKRYDKQEYRY